MIPVDTPETDIGQFAEPAGGGAAGADVRELSEYVVGHMPGAVLIPMGQLPGRTAELDRQAPVYLVCASGRRRTATAGVLRSAGSTPIRWLAGRAGGPLGPSRAGA